ncbi:MAG: DMT family transporter [Actinobacteria bacterium]|nr:DMT family transporter [Actinomycetota bacterium]
MSKRLRLAPFALLAVSMMWGSTFVLMKSAIKRQDVNSFLFSRFALAVLAMILLRPRVLKLLTKDMLSKGFFAGCFLASGYILQTLGLARTTAAVTGFVTGLYVVATPLIGAIILKQKISRKTWIYVGMATIGLALLSLHGWSIGTGELLVLASAIAFASHIIALEQWSSGRDTYALTIVQLATCALLTGIASLKDGYQPPPDNGVWAVVIFTAIFATAIAFIVQTWSQAHMASTKVAVILTMEVVFAAIFAILFGGESLTLQISLGGILVVSAMYFIVMDQA